MRGPNRRQLTTTIVQHVGQQADNLKGNVEPCKLQGGGDGFGYAE